MEPRAPLPTSAAAPLTLASPATAPLAPALPAIVALCEDQALWQEVGAAIGEQASVIPTPTQDRFVDQLVANCAEVAVIDAEIAANKLGFYVMELRRQFPQLRILLMGPAALQDGLRSQVADGTVFGFAQQPVAAERLKLLLLAALRAAPPEALPEAAPGAIAGLRGAHDAAGPDEDFGAATMPAAAPMVAPIPTRPRWLWPLLLCLTTLGAMIVGWFASSFASQRHLLP